MRGNEGKSVKKGLARGTGGEPASCALIHGNLSTMEWDKSGLWTNRRFGTSQDKQMRESKIWRIIKALKRMDFRGARKVTLRKARVAYTWITMGIRKLTTEKAVPTSSSFLK